MKKLSISLLLLWVSCTCMMAHTISVGYVNKKQGSLSELFVKGKTSGSVATCIDASMLAQYTGNEVRTVRVALPSDKKLVDSVVVWVRASIDGPNVSAAKLTRFQDEYPTMQQGWNEVTLDKPYAIAGSQPLYVGYTYYQRTKVCYIQTVETVDNQDTYVKLGAAAEWTQQQHPLAIEIGIDGSSMPQQDVWLMKSRGLIEGDGTRQVVLNLYNHGQQPIRNITFNLTGNQYDKRVTQAVDLAVDEMGRFTVAIPDANSVNTGDELNLVITQVNGETDGHAADNQGNCLFNYRRIVLIEEFTTEQCPNCPDGAEKLHEVINSDEGWGEHIAAVCHHSGYHTDDFTTAADLSYEWFYNADGGTFAPAMMFNRIPIDGAPTVFPSSSEMIATCVNNIIEEESALVISAKAVASENGKTATVTVKGQRIKPFGNTDQRITVFLTEDNVQAKGQADAPTAPYYHQHLMRAVNATWGEPVDWEDDDFSYTCTFTLDESWKKKDLTVVASVGSYDSSDPCNCQVENSAVAKLTSSTTGIVDNTCQPSSVIPSAYYTISGTQLATPMHGINVVRYSDGTVRNVLMK